MNMIIKTLTSLGLSKPQVIETNMSEYDRLLQSYHMMSDEVKQAEHNLNHAEPDFIDAAVFNLAAKNEARNVILRKIRTYHKCS